MKKIIPKSTTPIKFGDTYTNCITGETGIACVISINRAGEAEVALQSKAKRNSDHELPTWHHWVNLTTAPQPPIPDYLGCELTDSLSGFVGVAIMSLSHISRCSQVLLQKRGIDPKTKKPYEPHTFDDMWVLPKANPPTTPAVKDKPGCCTVSPMRRHH